ncbi:helix-turn-helix domain-containing protein [Nereida sp. MMG025]|uniref:helix-turn-helix domain-containing protein n=1 Tax=Nereida sp. MMG025 TaxID=2909981 RepID=UPI00351D11EE|nr:helix-turn-helix domain-containing protein [Nereida sp. MMG025]
MAGTVHTEAYKAVLGVLIDARGAAGLSQAALADRLGKPASFVGKYELGERRLDIVELMVVLRALNLSFDAFWTQANVQLPETL